MGESIIIRLQAVVLISVKFLSENCSKSKTDFVSSQERNKNRILLGYEKKKENLHYLASLMTSWNVCNFKKQSEFENLKLG